MALPKPKRTKNLSWMKWRNYPHFGSKLTPADRNFVYSYVSDPGNIKKHTFFPLIYRQSVTRRYQKVNGKRCHSYIKDSVRVSTEKQRHIYYANHLDSMIFAYYAQEVLGKRYEELMKNHPDVDQAVIAYRKIPKIRTKNKSSVDFANEVFIEIRKRIQRDGGCAAVCLDIKSFSITWIISTLKPLGQSF